MSSLSCRCTIATTGCNVAIRLNVAIALSFKVLFAGTVRFNLDPWNVSSDGKLWSALEQAHLRSVIESLDGRLDHKVVEQGRNFAAGQRQLLCLVSLS